jgi:hypothetical protein
MRSKPHDEIVKKARVATGLLIDVIEHHATVKLTQAEKDS